MHNIGLATHEFEQIREYIFQNIPSQHFFQLCFGIHLYIVFYPINVYIKHMQFKLHISYANIALLDLCFDSLPYIF